MRAPIRRLLRIAAFAAATLGVRASLADHYRVPSGSMSPTVKVGDHVVVSKAAYGIRLPMTTTYVARYSEPSRGDVVVLESPDPDDPVVLLKRVVAVSGDRVEVRGGRVYLDGAPAADADADLDEGGGPAFGPTRVPDGELLVLGDNRGNSRDGRSFGLVPRERVLGRVLAIVARDGSFTYQPL